MLSQARTAMVLFAVCFPLAALLVIPVGSSGCNGDCECHESSRVATVSLECWCSDHDCAASSSAVEQRLCSAVPSGASVQRMTGCGRIRIGAYADRTPVGEHVYFDEATGQRAGGFVLGGAPFGPCDSANYSYGTLTECAGATNVVLCTGAR
jgi:hypothetical protein